MIKVTFNCCVISKDENKPLFLYMTYQIDIPAEKTKDVLAILKVLDVKVTSVKAPKIPNEATISAMNEIKAGGGRTFKNADELFKSIK